MAKIFAVWQFFCYNSAMFNHLSFQFFAWMGSLLFAAETIIVKVTSERQIKNPWLLNFAWTFIVCVINTAVCLYFGANLPKVWGNIFLTGLFFTIASCFYIFANYNLDVSTFSPLLNLQSIIVVFLGVMFLGESLNELQYIFIAMMIVGGILVTFDEKFSFKNIFSFGVMMVFATMCALALMIFFMKKSLLQSDYWTVNLWYYLIATTLMALTLPWFYKDIKNLQKSNLFYVLAAAIAGAIGNFAANKAYASNISISNAIVHLPASGILVMLLALIYPKFLEQHKWQVYAARLAGIILIVWAGIKLT